MDDNVITIGPPPTLSDRGTDVEKCRGTRDTILGPDVFP